MSFGITKKIVLAVLIIYGVMGLYVNTLPRHELYPFYAWNLFSGAPLNETAYFIKILRYGDASYDTLIYGDSLDDFLEVEYPPEFFWLVQEFEKNREEIESKFKSRPVTYQLVEVEYSPLEFKKYGKVINERKINEYRLY